MESEPRSQRQKSAVRLAWKRLASGWRSVARTAKNAAIRARWRMDTTPLLCPRWLAYVESTPGVTR
jgi:hypothetical protein